MSTHRKPPSRRTHLYIALVVAVAVFGVIIGFGGRAKNSNRPAASSTRATPTPAASVTIHPVTPSASAPGAHAAAPSPRPSPKPQPKPTPTSTGLGTTDGTLSALAQRVATQPVRVVIPALGVSAPVIPVGVDEKGQLAVPANVTQAAWYLSGSAPGQPGTAIIAAHVDFNGQLGLFNRLHTLTKGAEIDVVDAAGKTRRFHMTTGQLAPKSDPSTVQNLASAAASAGKPRLALITCGGDLNAAAHSYYDNYVLLADV